MSDTDPAPGGPAPTAANDPRAVAATRRAAVSVGVATGAYGVSFGALGVASGLDVLQTCALSALMFTGGSQFALVGILGAGGSGASAVAAASLLGVRNGFYGLQVSRLLDVHGLRRVAAAHLTIDESTAVAVGQSTTGLSRIGFWWTGLSVFVLWNLTTLGGALLGNALGDPRTYGLDAAAAAAFCALLWPRLRSREALTVALAAVALVVVVAPHVPAGVPILVAALAAVVTGLVPHGPRRPGGAGGGAA
ncbi:AzlC family ABC transporter permease [Agilicoccus flavus]|uniref:AzlC family ABC transporter permease n=1 Tax=Agilicoccus flavus TaxID=2775968 RepID=UPI001CF61AE3|nr:AzlC family ABC transporter permease [Agilicoccus flavus]